MLIVDAANVIGSRPDGWWRDRAGAAERFVEQIVRAVAAGSVPRPVTVVLEGRARRGRAAGPLEAPEVTVVHAPGEGDDTIAELAANHGTAAVVVTADRGLAARVVAAGAEVVGPRWLTGRLVD